MKYYIKVFGCQMNQSDAERIATILEKYKIKPAASPDAADLIIFVTCGVRQSAEDRVYGQINNLKKKYPEKKIILTGCLAHRKDVQRRLKGKVNLFTIIKDFSNKTTKILATNYQLPTAKNKLCNDYLKITPRYTNSHTAYIPIMTGCDNFCSYCVVPYARGREYSRPVKDILKEVKNLVKKGYKEIILLGQNVNSYHSKIPISNFQFPTKSQISKSKILNTRYQIPDTKKENISFAGLLKLINAIPGKFWVSFLTSHPKDMSDELIKTIAKSKKICEYVSLPVQSGNNDILKKMNRHYTVAHYRNLIKKIRRAFLIPSLRKSEDSVLGKLEKLPPAISTDIIVGFPGETKKQFENTAKLLREVKFDMAYIAQYSPRPETAAWKMKDNVSKKEKDRREKVLTEILKKTALENNKKYVGKVIEVLVDKILKLSFEELRAKASKEKSLALKEQRYLSHSRSQKKVVFFSCKKIPVGKAPYHHAKRDRFVGSFAKVKITKARAFGLEGEINQ